MRLLVPGRSYDLWARHLNTQGDWSPWRRSRFRTMDRVGMVSVAAASHNFLHISWEQETQEGGADREDMPTNSYVVNWQVRCVNTVTREESACVLPAHETSTKVVSLPHSTEYELAVRAKTGFGEWGPWGQPAFASTLPPLVVTLEAAGETWLSVTWARKEKKHNDGVSRYHLQLSAAETPFRISKYFPPDVTEYRFTDLMPGALYNASVQACVCDRWQSWSSPAAVRCASPAEVQLVRRGEDFVQLRWSSEYYTLNNVDSLEQKFKLRVTRLPDAHVAVGGLGGEEEELVLQEVTNVFGYRVAKLAAGSRIGCRVRAYDLVHDRWGNWSQELCVNTLPSVITFTMVAETCVEVAWQRCPRIVSAVVDQVPVGDDPLAPTEAIMYILRINEVDEDGRSSVLQKYHFTDQDKPFFIVEGLQPNSTYSAQLCTADSNQAWTPWSAAATVTTVPPLSLAVDDIGEDYAALLWERVRPAGGGKCMEETDTKYRIVAAPMSVSAGGGVESSNLLNYTVEGERRYTIRHLSPATSYRISISAYPRHTNIWGVWSRPVYVRTNDSIEVELNAVGEDYAHVSWRRVEPAVDELEDLHTGCNVVQVGAAGGKPNPALARIQRSAAERPSPQRGQEPPCSLHLADYVITEFSVKVFRVEQDVQEGVLAGEPQKTLDFERFVANDRDTLRIPQLSPNTHYEAVVCACNRKGEWGVWSNALPFCTTMPTEIVVADVTQEYVKVKWGRGVASSSAAAGAASGDADGTRIVRYELKIVSPDDDLCKEVLLPGTTHEYDVCGLSVNCCYAVTVRSLLQDDDDWGQSCHPVFIALRSIKTALVETSQDWLKVCWSNKPVPDGRIKKLFITLIGDHRAVTCTLPTGGESDHAFSDLSPLTVYSVHLLCVEHVPAYVRAGGASLAASGASAAAPGLPEGGRPTDTGVTVALPLIAADYSSFYTDGAAFSTLANIGLEVVKVGENFVTVRWGREVHAHGAAEAAREREAMYEVSCRAVGVTGAGHPQENSKITGTEMTLSHLTFNTLYELRVRKVSLLLSAWSKAATVQTLDRVKVSVGMSDVAGDSDECPVGVGEDFILLNWEKGLCAQITHAQKARFEVNCVALDGEMKPQGEPLNVLTSDLQYKLTDLEPDTRYLINVRSVIDDDGVDRIGEWSDDIVLATLAPMAVRVVAVAEEAAVIQWMRKGEDLDRPKAVHTIGSYHVKVFSLPRLKSRKDTDEEGSTDPPTVLTERQLLEDDQEFGSRQLRLTGLKPGHSYTAIVRASTENTWGSWSNGVTFITQPRVKLNIALVGEEGVFLEWSRYDGRKGAREPATSDESVQLAPCDQCELHVSTIGRNPVHTTRLLPSEPNRYRVGSLTASTQYSVRLRPVYAAARGPWSAPLHFVTLAPMHVEVSRIGETFVYVKWQRLQQQRIADRLRQQQDQQQEAFEEQQQALQKEIDAARRRHMGGGDDDDDGMFEKNFLSQQQDGQEEPADSAELDKLLRVQAEQQQKQRQLRKLQDLQTLDLERETRYPDGHDLRYEVVITGTNAPQQQQTEEEQEGDDDRAETAEDVKKVRAQQQPFSFRRRINCRDGEECSACKMDGLLPHTNYTVVVRAMYSNGYSAVGLKPDSEVFADKDVALLGAEEKERERQEAADQLLWGPWSQPAELSTLKQITLSIRGIGSGHCVADWDTGFAKGDAATAISQYQLMVAERDTKKGGKGTRPCQDIVLSNPSLESWTVVGLQPATQYTISIRVYYDDDRCGMWSHGMSFLTLPPLSARIQAVAETRVEVLVWRDAQPQDDSGLIVWRPPQSELQLSINSQPSPSTFKLDLDQSTLLALDDLNIDSEYEVCAREVDANNEWREWHKVVRFETLPCAPSKPQLDERRGRAITISWNQRKGLQSADYLYAVEMAFVAAGQRAKAAGTEHGAFVRVGLLDTPSLRLEPGEPVHKCLFRVKVCKNHQRLESGLPDSEDPYLWSQYSPVAHFSAPSVPQAPSQLKIINLRDTSATVKWRRPENWRQHTNLTYKVYLASSYLDRPICLGSTPRTSFRMEDLAANTHYRVGITAESSMGVSVSNHVLHFSTRVLPRQGPLYGGSDNPSSSTLPPRTGITMPRTDQEMFNRTGSPHSDAGRSYTHSPPGSPGVHSRADDVRSLLSAVAATPQRYPGSTPQRSLASRKGLPQRPATTIPPAADETVDMVQRAQSTQPCASHRTLPPLGPHSLEGPAASPSGATAP
eukprot:TRINITY_DN3105_c0_g2_i1.p1 TRINITY_DN3105_c0_g2~~TRINITY_DN3105_c0_g2_i1.p1  ORF type:complete len:2223 (+),score=398.42 TRINITY_DN3105_c0_g2_i1:984-7652(+)